MTERPTLLIENYSGLDHFESLRHAVLNRPFSSIGGRVPMCRFRGTVIEAAQMDKNSHQITGWQRNVSRIRGMDVSLPTVISMSVNGDGIITDIGLDDSFRGSKGPLCSWAYLDETLRQTLIGLPMTAAFIQAATVSRLRCFHLTEVLNGMYSTYRMFKERAGGDSFLTEEEVMDCSLDDGNCYAGSVHVFGGRPPVNHTLKFNDIFREVRFDRDGRLKGLEKVRIEFFINGEPVLDNTGLLGKSGNMYRDFLTFIVQCTHRVKTEVCGDVNVRFLNTNLFPAALVGLIVQAVAMQIFKNNYSYVMHALTALQRPNGVPLCLGAIRNREEAELYFEGYEFGRLLN